MEEPEIPEYTLESMIHLDAKYVRTFLDFFGIQSQLEFVTVGDKEELREVPMTVEDAKVAIIFALADEGKLIYPEGISSSNIHILISAITTDAIANTVNVIRKVGMEPGSDRVTLMLQYAQALSILKSTPGPISPLAPAEERYDIPAILIMDDKLVGQFIKGLKIEPDIDPHGDIVLGLLKHGLLNLTPPITADNLHMLIEATDPYFKAQTELYVLQYFDEIPESRYDLMRLYLESIRRAELEFGTESIPSFSRDIRWFFRAFDIDSMKPHGIDLSNYDSVKSNAEKIFSKVSTGKMPCDAPWSDFKINVFRQWIDTGMLR